MTLFARAMTGAFFLIALASPPSSAAPPSNPPPLFAPTDCNGSDTMITLTACYTKLLKQAEADMQAKYSQVKDQVKSLSVIDQNLTRSQDAWLAYRDQTCDQVVRLYWSVGDFENISFLSCKVTLTRERTGDLQSAFVPVFGALK